MKSFSCRVTVLAPNSKKPHFERLFELKDGESLNCETIITALRTMFGKFMTVNFEVYGEQ